MRSQWVELHGCSCSSEGMMSRSRTPIMEFLTFGGTWILADDCDVV